MLSEQVLTQYDAITDVPHPHDGKPGTLYRAKQTGMYWHYSDGRLRSVPLDWAHTQAVAAGKPSDWIREACVRRMKDLGLDPQGVWARVSFLSLAHVRDYLGRRSSIGSHKLQHILRALGLDVTERDTPDIDTDTDK